MMCELEITDVEQQLPFSEINATQKTESDFEEQGLLEHCNATATCILHGIDIQYNVQT